MGVCRGVRGGHVSNMLYVFDYWVIFVIKCFLEGNYGIYCWIEGLRDGWMDGWMVGWMNEH